MLSTSEIIRNAQRAGLALPAFNIPYLPMMQPVIQAVADQDAFALVAVARLEWIKFEAKSLAAVQAEFVRWNRPAHVRLRSVRRRTNMHIRHSCCRWHIRLVNLYDRSFQYQASRGLHFSS